MLYKLDMEAKDDFLYVIFYVTVSDKAEAERIVRVLLEQKCVACVSIVPGVESYFWWEGQIDTAQEFLLIGKTNKQLAETVKQKVKELHSYEVPEIIFVPVVDGNQPYLDWIDESLKK